MTRPLIFLDIDGVLARLRLGYRYGTLDAECVQALNILTDASDAEIVVSSSWRYVDPFPELVARLHEQGIRAPIIDKTPIPERQEMGVVLSPCRGDEIGAWLDQHGDRRPFVILDDEGDMGCHVEHLVRTNPELGLTPIDAGQALWILNHQPSPTPPDRQPSTGSES